MSQNADKSVAQQGIGAVPRDHRETVMDRMQTDRDFCAALLDEHASEIAGLYHLLKRAHGTLLHGAVSNIAHALLLHDIEKAVGLKSDGELLNPKS